MSDEKKFTPSDFVKGIIGRPVVVKLNSGVDYRGVLARLDGYMNIVLEQTEEYVNGNLSLRLKSKNNGEPFYKFLYLIKICFRKQVRRCIHSRK